MQECGFYVEPLFKFQFLRDCSRFLQIRSHICQSVCYQSTELNICLVYHSYAISMIIIMVLLFALCITDSKSNLSETLEDSDRKKQIEKGKEMPDETDPCQTAREESQPVKEKMNDDNWQNYIDELSNHQNDNYSTYVWYVMCNNNEYIYFIVMEVARRSHNSRGPSYSELKNRVEQLELSVAKLIGYE